MFFTFLGKSYAQNSREGREKQPQDPPHPFRQMGQAVGEAAPWGHGHVLGEWGSPGQQVLSRGTHPACQRGTPGVEGLEASGEEQMAPKLEPFSAVSPPHPRHTQDTVWP